MSRIVIDDTQQMLAGRVDDVGVFALPVRPVGTSLASPSISEKPMIALSGVRIHGPTLARKRSFQLLACSAASRAASISCCEAFIWECRASPPGRRRPAHRTMGAHFHPDEIRLAVRLSRERRRAAETPSRRWRFAFAASATVFRKVGRSETRMRSNRPRPAKSRGQSGKPQPDRRWSMSPGRSDRA